MAKSKPEQVEPGGYLVWSRDPAVGLFSVLPLWLLYELLRFSMVPEDRNGAEVVLLQEIDQLGFRLVLILRAAFAILLLFSAWSLVRRSIPWLRVAGVVALEGTVYGLLLGPCAAVVTQSAVRVLAVGNGGPPLAANLIGSLGAGIFEELLFRLVLMSALVWIGLRVVRVWSLPRWCVGVFAVLVSALVFAWFHNLCGEPFERTRFVFRTAAGTLLGLLMWFRGYGVCVYTHAFYDLHFYLMHTA